MSDSIGSYAITEQSDIKTSVTADVAISSDLSFSCEDNASLLGSEEESDIDFRKRILNTTDRQNTLVEMETEKIFLISLTVKLNTILLMMLLM